MVRRLFFCWVFGGILGALTGQTTPETFPDTLITLSEFEVVDLHSRQISYQVTTLTQRTAEISTVRDAGDLLRMAPNVSGIRKGGIAIDPVIRGFKYGQLNIQLNNGQKIEGGCPNRMDNPTAHVEVNDMREIEVLKGPFSLRFGPNFGGVVHMKTIRPLPYDKFKVHVTAQMGYESSWNGLKQQLAVNGGTKKVYFMLSGNYRDYGNYEDGNQNTVKTGFTKYNATAQLGLSPWKDHHFILSADLSYGRDLMFPALPMDERTDDTRLLSADYYGRISKLFNALHVKIYHSDVRHLMDNKSRPSSDTVVAIAAIHAINWGGRVEGGFEILGGTFNAGTDFENIFKDGERTKYFIMQPTLPVKTEMLWDDATIINNGFFAEFTRPLNKADLTASARLDFNAASSGTLHAENMAGSTVYLSEETASNHVTWSLSIGGTFRIGELSKISLSLGRGTRNGDMNERYIILLPIGYDKFDYLGNPSLSPEVNYEADLTYDFSTTNAGSVRLNAFYSYVTDYISGVPVPQSVVKPMTAGVLGVKQFENIGNIWLTGFEASYQTPPRWKMGADLIAGYTLGINPESKVYTLSGGEITGVETVKNDPLPEIPPFEATLSGRYRFMKGRLVPILSMRMVAAQGSLSKAFYEKHTPGFILLHFSFSYEFSRNLLVTGGISNIMDKAYYEHLNRNIIGSADEFYEPGRVFYVNLKFKI